MDAPFRRIVTGHDADGVAIVLSDGAPELTRSGGAGAAFYEVWNTQASPAPIAFADAFGETDISLLPPKNGTRIRVLDFPPEAAGGPKIDAEAARARFAALGAPHASTSRPGGPHPMMHRTETIDYGIILQGEIVLILDKSETILRQGDIVIQRGTNHAWSNRSGAICRVAFILIDGVYAPDVANALES
jgi:Cupin domain